jgi:ribose-phosphate pyrophosphokinase
MIETFVYSTQPYAAYAANLAQLGHFQLGQIERSHFPDGERYLRVLDSTSGKDVIIVGGTISDADTLEIYDLACSIVADSARRLTLVIPYFGYATMERAVKPGEIVTAKSRARLLSSVPFATMHNRALLLDLHSEGIPHYFEGSWVATHVYGKPVVTAAIKRIGGSDFVLACTDAGRA